MGACCDCIVTVDGRAGQRACLAKARDGHARGAARCPPSPAPLARQPDGDRRSSACDVLVVGAGPAGLSAAIAAAEAGAAVVVLDERAEPGGQYLKPLGAQPRQCRAGRASSAQGAALRAQARGGGRRSIHHGATVWGGFAPDEIAARGRRRHAPSPSARGGWCWPPARMNARCRCPAGRCPA